MDFGGSSLSQANGMYLARADEGMSALTMEQMTAVIY